MTVIGLLGVPVNALRNVERELFQEKDLLEEHIQMETNIALPNKSLQKIATPTNVQVGDGKYNIFIHC